MILRPATFHDSAFFLRLRNDPVTQASMLSTGDISDDEHTSWFVAAFENPDRHLFVAVRAGEDVGTGRLDVSGTVAEIDVIVAPEARGFGTGTEIIAELVNEARYLGCRRVVAKVKGDNTSSLRAFLRNGFAGTNLVQLERPCDSA